MCVDERERQREKKNLFVTSACVLKQGEVCNKQLLLTQDGSECMYDNNYN